MHIKKVIIEGFKSYGNRTEIESFSSRLNVVVGENGSGKSNFFSAIQFVLSDEYNKLGEQKRHTLIHSGTSGQKRVISATVQIVIDNPEPRRLPYDKKEVVFKRTVHGTKGSQYFINGKLVSYEIIMRDLQLAGFSKSNPYYIVKQGKINQLASTSDNRLKLLREIAGTNIYEEKKIESLTIFNETKIKLKKINDLCDSIAEQLQILEDEMSQYKDYQDLNKQLKTIERIICEKNLERNEKELNELQSEKSNLEEICAPVNDNKHEITQEIKLIEDELEKLQREFESVKKGKVNVSKENEILLKKKASLEYNIKDLQDKIDENRNVHATIETELEDVKDQIDKTEEELKIIEPKFDDVVQNHNSLKINLESAEQKCNELYHKYGRNEQFQSREERDEWIHEQLKVLKKQIEDEMTLEKNRKTEIDESENRRNDITAAIQSLERNIDQQGSSISETSRKYFELNRKNEEFLAKRRELYQNERQCQDDLASLEENYKRIQRKLISVFGKSMVNGNSSVETVIEQLNQNPNMKEKLKNNYHGLVIDTFQCKPQLYRAVEEIAGNRLYNHIVETNSLGNDLLGEINRQRLPGNITFMPLDRLKVFHKNDPPSLNDGKPLIRQLQYNPQFDVAYRNIFGNALVCRDLATATSLSREHKVDCVTLDGERVSSKGWLKGGYCKSLNSSISYHTDSQSIRNSINELRENLEQIQSQIADINRDIDSNISEMQRLSIKQSKARDVIDQLMSEQKHKNEDLNLINIDIDAIKNSLHDLQSNLRTMRASEESLKNELGQDLTEMSSADQKQIKHLNTVIIDLKKHLKKMFEDKEILEVEKNRLKNYLLNNLYLKRNELSQRLKKMSFDDNEHELVLHINSLRLLQNAIDENEKEFDKLTGILNQLEEKITDRISDLEKLQNDEKKLQEETDDNDKRMEKLLRKIGTLEQQMSNNAIKLAELEAKSNKRLYKEFNAYGRKQLDKKLADIKHQLKQYGHVNKKALDQYDTFKERKDVLFKRREELIAASVKIEELIQFLQRKKCEAVEKTFEQVSKNFSEIFKRLVPLGSARLELLRGRNESESMSEIEIDADDYLGIDLKVKFSASERDMVDIARLSGGQKSLVALTLIFAIQKCDPAPFYLFDEIDQALDAGHRRAVAEMINELSENAQFIMTTFRPELLDYAEQCYGVNFVNNISHVYCIGPDAATSIVNRQYKIRS